MKKNHSFLDFEIKNSFQIALLTDFTTFKTFVTFNFTKEPQLIYSMSNNCIQTVNFIMITEPKLPHTSLRTSSLTFCLILNLVFFITVYKKYNLYYSNCKRKLNSMSAFNVSHLNCKATYHALICLYFCFCLD